MAWEIWRAIIVGMIGGSTWCFIYSASAGILRPLERVLLLLGTAATLLAVLYWLVLGVL